MPNILIPITSPRACSGERGTYFAFTYFSRNRDIEFTQLRLGRYSAEFEESTGVIEIVRKRLAQEATGLETIQPVPLRCLAAISIVRACDQARHIHGESNKAGGGVVGERVAAYILVKSGAAVEGIHEELGKISSRGFQHASLGDEKSVHYETDRLIHLPSIPSELRTHPVRAAIATTNINIRRGHEPFAAIHAGPDGRHQIEQFLHEDDLVA